MPIIPGGKFVLREDLISDIASYRSVYGRVLELASDRIRATNDAAARANFQSTIDLAKAELARADSWEAVL